MGVWILARGERLRSKSGVLRDGRRLSWTQADTVLANGEVSFSMVRDGRVDGGAIGDDELQRLIDEELDPRYR